MCNDEGHKGGGYREDDNWSFVKCEEEKAMGKLSIGKLWMIAYRDLGRNRRRSVLTLLAVALGLALLIFTNGMDKGLTETTLKSSIYLRTGHVQVREESYDEDKVSLEWEDLLDDPQGLAAQAQALEGVQVATPVLWTNGLLSVLDESVGVQVIGIDPLSEANAPYRERIVAGGFLDPDDRGGILMGRGLAEELGVTIGHQISLLVSTADAQPDEATFTIRGLFNTGIPAYDETMVLLPLSKAQAFTHTGERASAIFTLLDRREDADAVASALRTPERNVLTWRDLNRAALQSMGQAGGMMTVMNLVVLAMVASAIVNTLLMAVFERRREMGILATLGMKGRQILAMFLLEAATLGVAGIALGILLGGLVVTYVGTVGWEVGGATGIYGSTIYTVFSVSDTVSLSVKGLIITLLASLYPAWFAARMEPIDALRAL